MLRVLTIIDLVLLGKVADMGAVFGSGASSNLFGATISSKVLVTHTAVFLIWPNDSGGRQVQASDTAAHHLRDSMELTTWDRSCAWLSAVYVFH